MTRDTNDIRDILKKHNIRVTQNRVDILSIFRRADVALSQNVIENEIKGVDRITLYRTLKTFESEGIIHQAIDGSGVAKFAMCNDNCNSMVHLDDHAHFHCTQCDKTLCIDHVKLTEFKIPFKFQLESAHLVLKGKCDQCSPNSK